MEWLVQLGGLSYDDKIHFNCCRLAYRAMTITDVINRDGTKVTRHALDLSHLSRALSKWDWPNEHAATKISYVGTLDWSILPARTWVSPFSSDLSIGYSHHISTGNGSTNDVITFSTTQQIMHVMFFAPFPQGLRWLSDVSRSFLYYQCQMHHVLEWATVWYECGHILFEGAAVSAYPAESVYDSIYDFIQQWEDSWPLADSFFPEDPSLIIQAITNGTATMVSDGSYKPFLSTEIGAAAWILECSATQASCFGQCSTTGIRKEVNAYRCEVQGCHAWQFYNEYPLW